MSGEHLTRCKVPRKCKHPRISLQSFACFIVRDIVRDPDQTIQFRQFIGPLAVVGFLLGKTMDEPICLRRVVAEKESLGILEHWKVITMGLQCLIPQCEDLGVAVRVVGKIS